MAEKPHDRQLHLFGAPETRAEAPGVGPAEVEEELRQVAAALPAGVHLGTSSWSFPGWNGLVYDREASPTTLARRGLAAYAAHPLLNAVGIDRTFYGPVSAPTFAGYANAVGSEFRFLVKAASQCTSRWYRDSRGRPSGDNPAFLDAIFAADEVVAPLIEGLGPRAGPLVFQFPPVGRELVADPARFAERLAGFLTELPRGPTYAVELRDRELLGEDYAAALNAAGAVHCLSLHPRMPAAMRQLEIVGDSTGPLVVRWMLNRRLDYQGAKERYAPFDAIVDEDVQSRETLAELALARARTGRDVFVIANNKAEGSAPLTVFRLAERIVGLSGAGR